MGGHINDEFKSRNLDLKKRVEQMEASKEDDSDESCERSGRLLALSLHFDAKKETMLYILIYLFTCMYFYQLSITNENSRNFYQVKF